MPPARCVPFTVAEEPKKPDGEEDPYDTIFKIFNAR